MQLIHLLLLSGFLFAQDPPADTNPKPTKSKAAVFPILLPANNAVPVQPVVPISGIPVLVPGQLLIVKSDVKFMLLMSDKDLVNYRKVKGPRDISGVFADGNGQDEDRTYEDPFLAIIKAEKGKSGRVKITYIPSGAQEEDEFVEILIDIGVAPQPPPKPDEPKPDEPIPVVPVPVTDTFKATVQTITAKYASLPATDKTKIAKAWRTAASKIEDGTVTDPGKQLTQVTADLMIQEIGHNALLPWIPWRNEVTAALKAQPLQTARDCIKPWITVADVLEGK